MCRHIKQSLQSAVLPLLVRLITSFPRWWSWPSVSLSIDWKDSNWVTNLPENSFGSLQEALKTLKTCPCSLGCTSEVKMVNVPSWLLEILDCSCLQTVQTVRTLLWILQLVSVWAIFLPQRSPCCDELLNLQHLVIFWEIFRWLVILTFHVLCFTRIIYSKVKDQVPNCLAILSVVFVFRLCFLTIFFWNVWKVLFSIEWKLFICL